MFLKKPKVPLTLPIDPNIASLMQDYIQLATAGGSYSKGQAEADFMRMIQDPRVSQAVVNLETNTLHVGTALVTLHDGKVWRRIGQFILSMTRSKQPLITLENIEPLKISRTDPSGVISVECFEHPHKSGSCFCTEGRDTALLYVREGNITGAVRIYLDALYSYNDLSKYRSASDWPALEENDNA
jgi:hypothetical protein